MDQQLKEQLLKRSQKEQLRSLKVTNGLEDFSSNDYLSLSRNVELQNDISKEYSQLDIRLGSGGSRLLSGNSDYFESLENQLAAIHKGQSALLMNSGYVANLAVFSTLPKKGDTVIYDELIHTCIKDGVRLSNANHFSFKHNDLSSLKAKLKIATGQVFIAVESVYSMDGDMAPLKELSQLCNEKGALLIVDEAHSTGVFGKNGSGLCCELGIEDDVYLRIHTFGKGMGCHGACVVGSQTVKHYLINYSRPFIYTTAMPLHGLVTIKNAYDYLSNHKSYQLELERKIDLFKKHVNVSIESNSPIQVVIVKGNSEVKKKALQLQQNGFDVRPVMSPTVKEGQERLRICIHTHNSDESILKLASLL